jgi:hypothetical protein
LLREVDEVANRFEPVEIRRVQERPREVGTG